MATLICTIELDKEKGITVKVEDTQGQITQTVTMDGKSIKLEMKSSSHTSTIEQKAESVTVTCQDFTVDADTIVVKSKKTSSWTSQDTLKLESTKDMTFTSSAKLTQSATSDAKLSSSSNVNVEATSKLTLKGMSASMSASAGEAKVDGVTLKLAGQSQAELSGAMTKVSATGNLDLQSSGLANLKGSMTTVGGSLVKLG